MSHGKEWREGKGKKELAAGCYMVCSGCIRTKMDKNAGLGVCDFSAQKEVMDSFFET